MTGPFDDVPEGPAPEPEAQGTWTPPPHWMAAPPPPPRHRASRLAGPLTAVVALAVAAGAIGYAIGDNPSAPRASSPFNNYPIGNSSPGSGSNPFNFPGFNFPGSAHNYSSSTDVPDAVTNSEAALVDFQTSIDDGQASGAATGIVLTSGGLVLTNNHVIDGATTVSVTDLGNSKTYSGTVLGYSVADDVALVKLQGASGLQTATFDTSPTSGQDVYAVGNAGGYGGTPTVTAGKLTSLSAKVDASDSLTGTSESLSGMLATNANVISGDSGGELASTSGEVLGVVTASGPNGGFAIPASRALSIVHEIESGEASATVHVGETALLGVDVSSSHSGAYVESVLSGTAASSAGITVHSTVTSVDGTTISSSAGLRSEMLSLQVGERVSVHWTTSSGLARSAEVTLTSGPAQ